MKSNTTNNNTGSQCESCWYFQVTDFSCRAFPLGIPDDILLNARPHDAIQQDQINTGDDVEAEGPAVVQTSIEDAEKRRLKLIHRFVTENDIYIAEILKNTAS
jgi:hypothetical protein